MRNALLIALAVILTACAPVADVAIPEPTITGPSPAAEPTDDAILRAANAEIVQIVEKSAGVRSIVFDVANLPDKGAWATYRVRGSKARVDIVTPIPMEGWSADTIYLDLDAKTAEARCIALTGCKKENRRASTGYGPYGIVFPLDWGDRAVYGERTGTVTFNDRPTAVVRREEEGKTFEAYIDTFYGAAQRVAVLDLGTEPPTIIGGYEYRNMAYNTVAEADVTAP